MNTPPAGMLLVIVGVVIVVIGLLAMTGALGWFGRLPGDIRYESGDGRVTVFIPIVAMLLISVVLSVAVAVTRRLF